MLLQDFLYLFYLLRLVQLLIFQLDFLFFLNELKAAVNVLRVFHVLCEGLHHILHLLLALAQDDLLVLCPEVLLVSLLLSLNLLQIDCSIEQLLVVITEGLLYLLILLPLPVLHSSGVRTLWSRS